MVYIFERPLLVYSICLFILGGLLFFFPPKKINGIYGYKTASSMSSQEKWDFAQKYTGKIMIIESLIMIIISFFIDIPEAIIFIFIIASIVPLLIIVENKLKNK